MTRFAPARRRGRRVLSCLGLVAAVAAVPASAGPIMTDAWVMLGAGLDTNPLRTTGDGADGSFVEARYDAEVDHVFTRRLKWFFDADGEGRGYESELSGGDRQSHDARLGLGVAPLSARRKGLLFQFGATHGIERNDFLDRTTGEPYTISVPDGAGGTREAPIPDRYSADTLGAFADAYWRPWKRTRLSIETGYERVSYRQDYPPGSSLRPLDHGLVRVEPGVHYRVSSALLLGLSVYFADIDYDEERARDATGTPIPGSRRELRYADARLIARFAPLERLRLSASLRGGDRSDPLEGYYDYSTLASYVQLDLAARENLYLRLSGYWRDRDDAEIPLSQVELEQRQSDRRRIRGTVQWRFHPHVSLFGEAATESDESWEPEYTHDRRWILAGLTFGS